MVGVTATRSGRAAGDQRAELIVAADGRHSTLRDGAGLRGRRDRRTDGCALAAAVEAAERSRQTLGRIDAGRIFIMLDRNDYWQCAFVIPEGRHRRRCMRAAWRRSAPTSCALAPFLHDRVHELASWDDVKLLTVAVNRLDTWYRPGLLCIGDAAHAMSPVGGVGINLAIQDAVATANILVPPLREGSADARMICAPCSAAANGRRA